MKTGKRFREHVLSGVVIIAFALLAGCESDRDSSIRGVRFTNESSHEVTVFYGQEQNVLTSTLVLRPGKRQDVTEWAGLDKTIYYDHQPKDTVIAHQKASNHVIFTDAVAVQ